MSFQAYLDAVETKTGLTPRQLIAIAQEKGLDAPGMKAGAILAWLKDDYGLGRGHGMAIVHIITRGPTITTKHVGTDGVHRDESDTLWLDGGRDEAVLTCPTAGGTRPADRACRNHDDGRGSLALAPQRAVKCGWVCSFVRCPPSRRLRCERSEPRNRPMGTGPVAACPSACD